MSVMNYGPVRMQIQETHVFGFGPTLTEDGVDTTCTEVDLGVTAIVNMQALATSGRGAIAGNGANVFDDAPVPGAAGDPLGISLRNLRAMLLTPRQPLSFAIAGNPVVSTSGPDSRNGPQPQPDTCVQRIFGTATARVYFHVKTWLQDFLPISGNAQRIVLANRFLVQTSLDQDYWTTRYVQGQLIVDPGQLWAMSDGVPGFSTPDSFRSACFLSIPLGFKRDNVQVAVSSDNRVLDYSYIDSETPLALGARSFATRIEGNCTAGSESPLGDMGLIAQGAAVAAGFAVDSAGGNTSIGRGFFSGLTSGFWTDPGGVARSAATLSYPRLKANGIVRIWGSRDASKYSLMILGINILSDRFRPIQGAFFSGNLPFFNSLYVTQDLSERYVEVRGEFSPTLASTLWNLGNTPGANILGIMNLATDIQSGGAAGTDLVLSGSGAGFNPPPPNSDGTRGNYLGALLVSLLSSPGQVPDLPVDPVLYSDRAGFI